MSDDLVKEFERVLRLSKQQQQPLDDKIDQERLEMAKTLFIKASRLEAEGEISGALSWYHRAYRLEPHVDKLVDPQLLLAMPTQDDQKMADYKLTDPGLMALILANHKPDGDGGLTKSPLKTMPPNVMSSILKHLVVDSPEACDRVAATCRGLYIQARSNAVWTVPMGIITAGLDSEQPKRRSTVRDTYLKFPRPRFGGLYVGNFRYFRDGSTEGSYFAPVHLVTYFRYFAFFPTGQCYALVSTEGVGHVAEHLSIAPDDNLLDRLLTDNKTWSNTAMQQVFGTEWRRPNGLTQQHPHVGRWTRRTADHFDLTLMDPLDSRYRSLMTVKIGGPRSKPWTHGVLRVESYVRVTTAPNDVEQPGPSTTSTDFTEFGVTEWPRFHFTRSDARVVEGGGSLLQED